MKRLACVICAMALTTAAFVGCKKDKQAPADKDNAPAVAPKAGSGAAAEGPLMAEPSVPALQMDEEPEASAVLPEPTPVEPAPERSPQQPPDDEVSAGVPSTDGTGQDDEEEADLGLDEATDESEGDEADLADSEEETDESPEE